jgi:hypothetical protein
MIKTVFPILLLLLLGFSELGCKSSEFSSQTPKKSGSGDTVVDPSLGDDDDDQTTGGSDAGDDDDDDLGGGGGDNSGDTIEESFKVGENGSKVDVLMFFDQSGSMDKFITEVSQRLGEFVKVFMQSKKNLDYRLLVVAGNFTMPVQNNKVGHLPTHIGNHNAIDVFKQIVSGDVSTGSIKLRKNSTKEFIVVSNDNSNQTAAEFASWVKDNRKDVGRVHINGFVGFKSTGPLGYLGPCYIDKAGTNYIEMAKHKDLGGLVQDMCTGDWDALMSNLGKKISNVDSNVFDLKEEASTNGIEVTLNGKKLGKSEWSYDEDDNSIEISADLDPQDDVKITYIKK